MLNTVASNIAHIEREIAQSCRQSGRSDDRVMLLAVTKTVNVERILEAVAGGQRRFGENYVQEAVEKIQTLRELHPELLRGSGEQVPLEWHLIGPLQNNKTRIVAEYFDWVQSLDALKTAQRLSAQRPADLPDLQICIQVNVDAAATKGGVPPNEVLDLALALQALPRLRLRGLMSIPNPQDSLLQTLALHARVHDLLHKLNQHPAFAAQPLDTLSMGMSGDMHEAIAAGSTMVRIGTAIFGAR